MGTSPASNASKKNFEPWLSGKAGTELLKPVATDVVERRSVSSIESTAFLRAWRALRTMGRVYDAMQVMALRADNIAAMSVDGFGRQMR